MRATKTTIRATGPAATDSPGTLDVMKTLSPDVVAYKRTRTFDQDTVPAGLLRDHATRAGVWGRICVEAGRLRYRVPGDPPVDVVLEPGVDGVVEPEVLHSVEPVGAVRFHVEFLRRPDV